MYPLTILTNPVLSLSSYQIVCIIVLTKIDTVQRRCKMIPEFQFFDINSLRTQLYKMFGYEKNILIVKSITSY